MREIALDTETTGLDPAAGHRVIEIGCVEIVNRLPSGRRFQCYLNPERDVPAEAVAIHGLTAAFLAKHKTFAEEVAEFLEFIGDSKLVIHNAEFDLKFVNAELARLGFAAIESRRAVDTMRVARQRFPGAPASLDALCQRFAIDTSHRTLHGALKDAELLAEVYLELSGGRQAAMELVSAGGPAAAAIAGAGPRALRPPRPHAAAAEELAAHAALVERLKNPIWKS